MHLARPSLIHQGVSLLPKTDFRSTHWILVEVISPFQQIAVQLNQTEHWSKIGHQLSRLVDVENMQGRRLSSEFGGGQEHIHRPMISLFQKLLDPNFRTKNPDNLFFSHIVVERAFRNPKILGYVSMGSGPSPTSNFFGGRPPLS